MHYVTFHHLSKFQTNLSTFQWGTSKELPRSSLNLYALLKIFEFSKLENYKSDINETWPRYVPSGYLNITKMRVSMNGRVEGGAQTKNHQKMP